MVRHNVTANGLYALPFHRNKFVDGWQLGAIFSFHTGTPYDAVNGFNIGNDIRAPKTVPNVSNESGCNGNPVNPNPVTPNGVFWTDGVCFAVPQIGEPGNASRNSIIGPNYLTLDNTLQSRTPSFRSDLLFSSARNSSILPIE